MKIYSKKNFHKHTFCLWNEVSLNAIARLDFDHSSKSGSSYIFVETGVYRISNHWGRVANCRWRLLPLDNYKNQQFKVGFATWSDFFPNDETLKLFFISVKFDTNEVTFFHKLSPTYDNNCILRSAVETSKLIKTIKLILNETSWANHFKYDDIKVLRKEIALKLVNTEQSFLEIKKKYLLIP